MLVLALVVWSGVLLQLWLSLRLVQADGKSLAAGLLVYLGYFTVLTNIFVGLTLTLPSLVPSTGPGRFFARSQTAACAATSIALVALGYHFLLRHTWNPEGLQWIADVLLHYAVPTLFCVYWLLALPKEHLAWWSPLAWCTYPIAYFVYVLIRGSALGIYPYPFIDVATIGYRQTLLNALGLLAGFVLVGWLFLALAKTTDRRDRRVHP